ncbi:MAG: response regulator [Spirochaetia bacterium]|nr:response regulator [Spirochaetia bacterium]
MEHLMKILFVDDEPLTRTYLRQIIDWEELGMTVTGEAGNGKEALQLLAEEPYDIMITDIRMPVIDGIELIRAIRETSQEMKIIVLSAYSDFEYARTVFSHGITGYLIKPINEEKLLALVQKAQQELQCSIEEAQRSHFTQTLAAETLLWEQITKPNTDELFFRKFGSLQSKPDLSRYQLVSLTFTRSDLTRGDVVAALHEASPLFEDYGRFIIRADRRVWLMILEQEIGSQEVRLAEGLLHSRIDPDAFILVSGTHSSPSTLSEAYRELNYLTALRFYANRTHYVFYRRRKQPVPNEPSFTIYDAVNRSILLLQSRALRDIDAYMDELDEMTQQLYGDQVEEYRNYWTMFALLIRTRIEQSDALIHLPRVLKEFEHTTFQDAESSEQILLFLKRCFAEVLKTSVVVPDNQSTPIVQMIKEYIQKNYQQKVSLDSIAEAHELSKNYVCRVFHDATGVPLWDYLTMVRIEHAKQMLSSSAKTTGEIAQLVGYENQGYFSSVFKKKTGISPKKFRKDAGASRLCL